MAVGLAGKTPAEAKKNPIGPSAANYKKDQGWHVPPLSSILPASVASILPSSWTAPDESNAESARLKRFAASENVQQKTENKNQSEEDRFRANNQQIVVDSGQRNVLNNYRSITYSFTLAVLDNGDVADPNRYRNSELKNVILKSGGKGERAINGAAYAAMMAAKARSDFAAHDPRRVDLADNEKYNKFEDLKDFGTGLVNDFNKESPGKFDMFVSDVTIETMMSTNDSSNSTLPTKIKFDIFEPYSINGFIEALYVASLAANYDSYLSAVFLLKLEFWGYPDNADLPEPELIEGTERYFPFAFTEINVDVTENGTRYQCGGVPFNERAYGQTNVIKKPIKMEGRTVGEILENLFKNINAQVKESDDNSRKEKPQSYDRYFIKFPTRGTNGALTDKSNKNITDKLLTEILKDNALYAMNKPEDTEKPNNYQADNAKKTTADKNAAEPESIKYNPGSSVVNFPQNMTINDAIASVVRDSDYVKNILKDMGRKPNVPDQFGFVEYFIIRLEATNQDKKDPLTKKFYQNFIYNVVPYMVHYTRIPGYGQSTIKEETFKKLSTRTYNYIYTGQNVDVINFKLNFNTLYFEAVPEAMGNKDTPPSKTGAAPGNSSEIRNNYANDYSESVVEDDRRKTSQIPKSPVKTIPTSIKPTVGVNAGQQKSDPYSVMARHMHESVVNSKASMITGDIEILGDPYYISTGGIGNYNPASVSRGTTKDGEADHTYGSVLITINFRNPLDFNSLKDGGLAKFDSNRVPFSGVYQVLTAVSTFKDGIFKQKLDIMRMPGQVLDSNLKDSDPADKFIQVINPDDVITPNETRALSPEQRADSTTLMDQLNRGLPSPGLPGIQSNFTNVAGGLSGYGTGATNPTLLNQTVGQLTAASNYVARNPVIGGLGGYGTGATNPSLLNQTAGQISGASISKLSVIAGQPLPDANSVMSNVRLQASGLTDLSQTQKGLGSASLIAAATNVLTGNLPIERAVGLVGGSLVNSLVESARQLPNIGSGIGKGATVSIDNTLKSSYTANELVEGQNVSSVLLPSNSISNTLASASIDKTSINAVASIGGEFNKFTSDVGNKINSLTASSSDPKSIAAAVGLNPDMISGLKGASSKLTDQINQIAKNVPDNVNLKQAESAGLVLNYIPSSKIANIPATPPYSVASAPQADPTYAASVVKRGGIAALANLYGVSDISKISSNLVPTDLIEAAKSRIPDIRLNPFSKLPNIPNSIDANVIKDKLDTAKSQLSSITGQYKIPDTNSLGSISNKFGSISSLENNPIPSTIGNDPNALSYNGTDPATRARLGLPALPVTPAVTTVVGGRGGYGSGSNNPSL